MIKRPRRMIMGQRKSIHSQSGIGRIEVLVILLLVILVAGYVGFQARSDRRASQRAACLANLGRIGEGLQQYLNAHDQRWPYVSKLASLKLNDPPWPTLPEALKPYVRDSKYFHCPADRRTLAVDSPLLKRFPSATTWYETEGTSYEWIWGEAYGGAKVGEEMLAKAKGFGMGRADQPLIADFEPFHAGDALGDFNTLNADLKPRTTRARGGR